jgi:hypothetical protein
VNVIIRVLSKLIRTHDDSGFCSGATNIDASISDVQLEMASIAAPFGSNIGGLDHLARRQRMVD